MNWGFYCRTCGVSSPRFYQHPEGPRHDLAAVSSVGNGARGGVEREPSGERAPKLLRGRGWVASHAKHDLWAECDSGVLQLAQGSVPEGLPISLPGFVKR